MTGLQALPQGRGTQHPAHGGGPASVFKDGKPAFRRYLLVSSGISSTALGLALIISFFAAGYGEARLQHLTVADGSAVEIAAGSGELRLQVLDDAPAAVVTSEATATVEAVSAALPALAINLEPSRELSPEAPVESTPRPSATPTGAIVPPGATPVPPRPPTRPGASAQPPATAVTLGRVENVNLTFYDCLDQGFCGAMKSGTRVYEGAAACSWNLAEGTRFRIIGDPTRRIYVCEDRGLLENTWVDIFFHDPEDGWDWQRAVGRYGTIEIVSLR
jgi:hypothetical protein